MVQTPEDTDPHSLFSSEIHKVPDRIRSFLGKSSAPGNFEKSWEFFVGAYGMAFDALVEASDKNWSDGQLVLPIFYLCRHSIELSLKDSILEYAKSDGREANISTHNLQALWKIAIKEWNDAGFATDDDWTIYCGKLLEHIHQFDPDGERFRYPTNRKGHPFDLTRVQIKELAVAHWHIGMVCDGSIGMLGDLGRQVPKTTSVKPTEATRRE